MAETALAAPAPLRPSQAVGTSYAVILAIALCHFINDVMQSVLSASYPLLRDEFSLTFAQIGFLSFAFMGTAATLQPVVGFLTDKRGFPQSMTLGMGSTLLGLLLLAKAPSYPFLVLGAALIGIGSAVFHPEASRVARAAAGKRFATAQSIFQTGGNLGHAAGPLLAAFIVVPMGRPWVAAFAVLAMLGMTILSQIGRWYARQEVARKKASRVQDHGLPRARVVASIAILGFLVFSKDVYTATMGSYYTFFLIERFGLETQAAQLMLFVYLGATAVGVLLGGLIGDRIGTRTVIWASILGVLPFTAALPYMGLVGTGVFTVVIGLVLASAFPAIVVFAQELVPGRVGLIAGLFYGFAFGIGGLSAAAMGILADARGIEFVYQMAGFLPMLGLVAFFLPRLDTRRA